MMCDTRAVSLDSSVAAMFLMIPAALRQHLQQLYKLHKKQLPNQPHRWKLKQQRNQQRRRLGLQIQVMSVYKTLFI